MKIKPVTTKHDFKTFFGIEQIIYENYPLHYSAGSDIMHLLIEGSSPFCTHAVVEPFLIIESDLPVGRFAFICDQNLPDHIQVAFFEALPGIADLVANIKKKAGELHAECRFMVAGLNGHLNYGAGILLNKFDEAPVFELPYTPGYYPEYFKDLKEKRMVTFRFSMKEFFEWGDKVRQNTDLRGITVRKMNKAHFQRDIGIYTNLNNTCFADHPYWSIRSVEEDLELFRSLGHFLREENLLFAEYNGDPVGFLFWLPNFNELLKKQETLGPEQLRIYQKTNRFNAYRFSEIAVLPKFRGLATLALILDMLIPVQKLDCKFGEGGFIFEENIKSVIMTKRYLKRIFGRNMEPYRRMAVYECEL